MRSVYLLFVFLPLYLTIHAQQKYTIHGKIELLSKSRNIHIGRDRAPIKSDGSFEISGEVPASHYAIIQTDSSQGDDIWLDAGTYTVDCRETTIPEVKSLLFRITTMSGPKDAELYNDFKNRIMYNYNWQGKKALTLRYVDSVFRYFPDAGPLSRIVIGAHYNLDDSVTEKYIGMLPPEVQNSGDIEMLEGDIKRSTKIRTEKSFEEFSMKTSNGELFTLSSLKGKKAVILDFWASDCAPCRAFHPELIKLYKKYNSRGLEIVSISLDSKRDAWLNAIEKDRINAWINVSELKGFESSLTKDYFLSYIPFRFLLDGNRKIIKVSGDGPPISESDIEAVLRR